MIDLIEHNVESAAVYVQSGQQSLKIAAALKPKIRRVSVCIRLKHDSMLLYVCSSFPRQSGSSAVSCLLFVSFLSLFLP